MTRGGKVLDFAKSGRSTRTFNGEGLWAKLAAQIRPGDFVLMAFGHNDGAKSRPKKYCPPPDYRANLAAWVAEIRAKGGRPIFVTPICRRIFGPDGRLSTAEDAPTLRDYCETMISLGKELGVDVVDMNALTAEKVQAFGDEASRSLYLIGLNGKDNTHTTLYGARVFADIFLKDVRKRNLPIAALFE